MSAIFNLDGTITFGVENPDPQEQLQHNLDTFEQDREDGFIELRALRDQALKECDWTQTIDCALDSSAKAEWTEYRTKLRQLPQSAKAPYIPSSDWPLIPGQSSLSTDVIAFVEANADPLGIATTSWVGITTIMVKQGHRSITGDVDIAANSIGIGYTDGLQVGDHLKLTGTDIDVGIISGITTISVSLASTTPVAINGDIDYYRVGNIYYEQERPLINLSVTSDKAGAGPSETVVFTSTVRNMIGEDDSFYWKITEGEEVLADGSSLTGTSTITPVDNVGQFTTTVSLASTITDPTVLGYTVYNTNVFSTGIGITVGITST